MLSYQFSKRNISVDVDIDSDVANVWADGSQLGQVLINILINSQQALGSVEQNRKISIRAYNADDDGCIEISIKDNGPGIPGEIRSKVFDHFFTTKPEGRGTGLGLSFCKNVVEAHGGSISVHDVAPQGTEVLIHLPGTTKAELSSSVPADSGERGKPLTVLVVDDEESLANSIAEVLTRYGHSPTAVFSADEALGCLNGSDFDVILADVHMPGVDGMEFYRRVQAMNAALADRFVFITGDALDPQLTDFFEGEHRPYINKPFEIRELIAIVQDQLKESSTHA